MLRVNEPKLFSFTFSVVYLGLLVFYVSMGAERRELINLMGGKTFRCRYFNGVSSCISWLQTYYDLGQLNQTWYSNFYQKKNWPNSLACNLYLLWQHARSLCAPVCLQLETRTKSWKKFFHNWIWKKVPAFTQTMTKYCIVIASGVNLREDELHRGFLNNQ